MSSDEADEDAADSEFYHNDQPVIIASDVEDIVLIADRISCGKILADFRQIMPLSLQSNVVPSLQRYSWISVSRRFIELFDFSMWDYVHNLSNCKVIDKILTYKISDGNIFEIQNFNVAIDENEEVAY